MNAERAVFVYTTYEKKALKLIDLVLPWLLVVDMRFAIPVPEAFAACFARGGGRPGRFAQASRRSTTRPSSRRAWGDSVGCSNP